MKTRVRVHKATRGLIVGLGCAVTVCIWSCTPAPRVNRSEVGEGYRPYRGSLFGPRPSRTTVQQGFCSYMEKELEGRRMASGGLYDPLEMTAAHRRLRFGTVVNVTNLNNGRSVRVVITDRGPFKAPERIIDVSYGAAVRLGMINQGVVPATVEVLGGIRDPDVVPDDRLVEAPQRQSELLSKAARGFERLVEWVLNKN